MQKKETAKKRVLFVVDSRLTLSEAPPSRAMYIAKSLKKKNFDAEVLGRKGERIEGLKVFHVGGAKQVARIKTLIHVYAKTLSNSYGAVIVRGELLAFFFLPLKFFGTKLILDFHSWLSREIKVFYEKTLLNRLKAAFFYIIERISLSHSNVVICVSEGIKSSLGRKDESKSIVLENGIDLSESQEAINRAQREKEEICSKYSIQEGKPLVGFLGNWERQLDMETMFKGADLAGTKMVVIGEGPKLEDYKKKWNNVRFLGRLPKHEALKVVCLCDAAVVPYKRAYATASFWSQRKVKDYLSLGKPILMGDVEEREAYLETNKNILLYKPGDAEDLAEKIRLIISDKELAEEMRQNNLKLASRYDWQFLVERSGLMERVLD